jgi:hypothetical protein
VPGLAGMISFSMFIMAFFPIRKGTLGDLDTGGMVSILGCLGWVRLGPLLNFFGP